MNGIMTCDYCVESGRWCGAVYPMYPKPPFGCTREKGHSGPHVACGTWGHEIEEWSDDVAAKKMQEVG